MQLLLVGFIVYFAIVSLIVFASYFYQSKQTKSNNYSQAILANRSINYFMTALSAHASDMSDWIFMAFPAALYAGGLINAWIGIGLVIGMWATWQFIAPELRKSTERLDSITLSTYFEKHFKDHSGAIRIISALISLLFFAVYIAAGLKGFGFLAESLFNISYTTGTIIAIIFAVLYIIFGGYRALAWVDCFQALFLLGVIIIVPCFAYAHVGGWYPITVAAQKNNISLNLFPNTLVGIINTLFLAFSWGVGYFGTPHILTKFMGIKDVNEMAKAQKVGLVWQSSVLFASGLSGLIGLAFFQQMLANKELVFVEMVKSLFSSLSAGFILSAVAGATLSVITAQILVLVSVLTQDLYKGSLRPKASNNELLWVYRFSIMLIALLSLCVSFNKSSSIQSLVQYAWIGFGCSFAPLVVLSLHSKYINRYGAIASIIIGGSIAALWHFLAQPLIVGACGLDIPAVVPGFILSIFGAYIVTYLTKRV